MRAGKGQEGGILPSVTCSLMMKVLGEEFKKDFPDNMDHIEKNFNSAPCFKRYRNY